MKGGVYLKKCSELTLYQPVVLEEYTSISAVTHRRKARSVLKVLLTALGYSAVLSALSVPPHPFWPSLHSVLNLKW